MSDFTSIPNKQKRVPKSNIKYKISLNEEQKQAKAIMLETPIVALVGKAGSGKTLVACQLALDMLFTRKVDKIIITRPNVASAEEIGYLPGSIKEKMDPWLAPIYANLYSLYDKKEIDKLVEEGSIEILPIAFVRGRTFVDAVVIVDEAQNVNHRQTEMLLGRLGLGSNIIFCGDRAQIDLRFKKESGISFFNTLSEKIKGVKVIELKENHRHPIVEEVLEIYEDFNSSYNAVSEKTLLKD